MTGRRAIRVGELIDAYGERHFAPCRQRVDDILRGAGSVVVHGAGHNGRQLARRLVTAGLAVVAFSDDTPTKIGTTIDGLPVIAPNDLARRLDGPVAAVVSIFSPRHDYVITAARLRAAGIDSVSVFEASWWLGGDALPFYFIDHPRCVAAARSAICRLAEHLADDDSLRELCRHLEFRLALRHDALPIWTDHRLMPAGDGDVCYIDGGAFDGDTFVPLAKALGRRLTKGIAIEPDPANHARLTQTLALECPGRGGDLVALHAALDSEAGVKTLTSSGTPGSMLSDAGDTAVTTITIDGLLAAMPDLPRTQVIKLDVEGAELRAIRGASQTIRTRAPMLAVAVYHRPADLWELADELLALQPAYRFRLRSHGGDGADLMLYAAT